MSRFSVRERTLWLQAFGNAVRHFRTEAGMSQEILGHRSDLDQTYVSGIERGRRNPTAWVMRRIATALGVTASDIIRLTEKLRDSD